MMRPEFLRFAVDSGMMAAGMSLYLSLPRADYLKGGFCSVNCKYLRRLLIIDVLVDFHQGILRRWKLTKEKSSRRAC